MSFKCLLCKKNFKFESKLKEHKKRQRPCYLSKLKLKCEECKIKFNCITEKERHEKTNKHIKNITIQQTNNCNIQIGDNNIQNIINLTLNVNSFKNTDFSVFGYGFINTIANHTYPNIMKKDIGNINKAEILFDDVIYMLEKLHFNISFEENHNLKILLMFPGLKKKVHEYLILEINAENKQICWNSLSYEDLILNILNNLLILNNRCENENYKLFINFLKKHLIEEKEDAEILKPIIRKKLSDMYINFNQNQKKEEREVKSNIEDKLKEYLNYRNEECKLSNGYTPEIKNSEIN